MQSQNQTFNERRASVRIQVVMRVFCGIHQSKLLTGDSVDLSSGGIYLKTTCPFDVDDNVKLKFFIPGQEENAVSCDARVAWINSEGKLPKPEYPPGAGLQFFNLAPEDLSKIVDLLEAETG